MVLFLKHTIKRKSINEQGFTLIEVLIAAVITAVGLLAVAQMQVISIKMNAQNRLVTQATLLAMGQLEYLKSLPFQPPDTYPDNTPYPLEDDESKTDLNDITGKPDHVHPNYPIDANGYPANPSRTQFGMFWNVADDTLTDTLEGDAKTVAVTVTWLSGPKQQKKHVTIPTVIRRDL